MKSKLVVPVVAEPKPRPHEIPMYISRNNTPEILIYLCGECNLRCQFCVDQARYSDLCTPEGVMLRLAHFENVLDYVDTTYGLDIVVFGGEIFQDKFGDDIFEAYEAFWSGMAKMLADKGIDNYQFYSTTNLIYHKIDRMIDFCKRWNIFIRASFDMVGRYKSDKVIPLFVENIAKVKQAGIPILVNFVAHKPNIEVIYNKLGYKYEVWKHLYDTYDMCLGEYNDMNLPNFHTTEQEFGEFLKYLYDHYPKITNVQNIVGGLVEGHTGVPYCAYNIVIDREISWQCCDRNKTIGKMQNNRGCLTCKYYGVCYGTCPRIFNEGSYCHVRDLMSYAEQKMKLSAM